MINKAISGDQGTSIIGDNNKITNITIDKTGPHILNRSILFEVCKSISDMDIAYDDSYSIKGNSDWNAKFEYNNVDKYIEIFENYSDAYDDVSKVINSNPKKNIMIKKIRKIYLEKEKEVNKKNVINGDEIIEAVFNEIKYHIYVIDTNQDEKLIDEYVDEAIYMIMFYTFSLCKLLKPVPKECKNVNN